jgi:hypothetical protein
MIVTLDDDIAGLMPMRKRSRLDSESSAFCLATSD